MSISLFRSLRGPWELVRGFLENDLNKIQAFLNNIPPTPTYIPPRATSITSSSTPSIDISTTDFFAIIHLSQNIISFSMNLSGSPSDGQKLTIRILDDGTPRSITWGPKFSSALATLPTTTSSSTYLYINLIYNSITSTWDCI